MGLFKHEEPISIKREMDKLDKAGQAESLDAPRFENPVDQSQKTPKPTRHEVRRGSFVSGLDKFNRPIPSEVLREVEGMPNNVLRIDFPDFNQENNMWINQMTKKLEILNEEDQRIFLNRRITLRSQVFQELRKFGIAIPRFKSMIAKQGDRLGSFTLVRKVDGKTVILDELSEEMMPGIIDYYSKLADYFLEKSRNPNWQATLRDVKAHQLMYGSIGDEPKRLYYVDVGMESISFEDDFDSDTKHNSEYWKTNTVHYRIYDLLDSIEIVEKRLGKDVFAELKRKLEEVAKETGANMMKYSKPFLTEE